MAEHAQKPPIGSAMYKNFQKQNQRQIRNGRRMKFAEANDEEHTEAAWDKQLKIGTHITPQIPVENAWQRRAVTKENSDLWSLFVSNRPHLLQEAVRDSVHTGTFHNIELYAYSKRNKHSGSAHNPTVFHARISFLKAASTVLRGMHSYAFNH